MLLIVEPYLVKGTVPQLLVGPQTTSDDMSPGLLLAAWNDCARYIASNIAFSSFMGIALWLHHRHIATGLLPAILLPQRYFYSLHLYQCQSVETQATENHF